jgi:hypothetical protein
LLSIVKKPGVDPLPWPDFTELTFGSAFLKEFERKFAPGGRFPTAPEFISQQAEATLGYDVEANLEGGLPIFFQFKRSFVLTTANAGEIVKGDFSKTPLFRMYLRKHNYYSQHKKLQEMEVKGDTVFYVTSQIASNVELSGAYKNDTILSAASALFRPMEIALIDDTDDHYITFEENADFGYVYSPSGIRFDRAARTIDAIRERAGRPSTNENMLRLNRFIDETLILNSELRVLSDKVTHPIAKASVLAFFAYDLSLTLMKP